MAKYQFFSKQKFKDQIAHDAQVVQSWPDYYRSMMYYGEICAFAIIDIAQYGHLDKITESHYNQYKPLMDAPFVDLTHQFLNFVTKNSVSERLNLALNSYDDYVFHIVFKNMYILYAITNPYRQYACFDWKQFVSALIDDKYDFDKDIAEFQNFTLDMMNYIKKLNPSSVLEEVLFKKEQVDLLLSGCIPEPEIVKPIEKIVREESTTKNKEEQTTSKNKIETAKNNVAPSISNFDVTPKKPQTNSKPTENADEAYKEGCRKMIENLLKLDEIIDLK